MKEIAYAIEFQESEQGCSAPVCPCARAPPKFNIDIFHFPLYYIHNRIFIPKINVFGDE